MTFGLWLAQETVQLWPSSTHKKLDVNMLQKCANPGCTVRFRSLREGKLFLADFEVPDRDAADGARRPPRRREYFWLCQACSGHFTLRFDKQQGMLTVPLDGTVRLVASL